MLSNDFTIAKDKRQLRRYFTARTFHFLKEYRNDNATQVSVSLPEQASILGGVINIEIKSKIHPVASLDNETILLKISRSNEDSKTSHFMGEKKSEDTLVILDTQVIIDGIESDYYVRTKEDAVYILTQHNNIQGAKEITIVIKTPSIYYAYHEPEPFTRTVLDLHIHIPFASKVLFALYYLKDFGLRGRIDNSEFLTFPLVGEKNNLLYYFFFPSNDVSLKCFFGDTDPIRLINPALPLMSIGLSLIALGYSALAMQKGISDLASTIFALSLFPTFYQFIVQKRSFWPDPDLTLETYDKKLGTFSLIIYTPLLLLTAIAMAHTTGSIDWADLFIFPNIYKIDLFAGLIFCMFFSIYWFLLNWGILQNFTCDYKEHRLWMRTRAVLHLPTRKSVCKLHYSDLITEDSAKHSKQ